jgi:mono/diheme cytochrome c family protein
MAKKPNEPREFEPEWLQRSLDRHYAWGLVFMAVLIIGFPIYRLREPHLRSTAISEQQTSYTASGRELFAGSCTGCHGTEGTGGGSAPTLNSKQFLTTATDAQIRLLISGGVPGSSMSAWSLDYGGALTDQQISELVAYLRSLEAKAPSIPDWRQGAKAG